MKRGIMTKTGKAADYRIAIALSLIIGFTYGCVATEETLPLTAGLLRHPPPKGVPPLAAAYCASPRLSGLTNVMASAFPSRRPSHQPKPDTWTRGLVRVTSTSPGSVDHHQGPRLLGWTGP